jgi:RNA polymerase sigma factor (sigma-70 family)
MALSEQHFPILDAARLGDPAALDRLLQLCQPDVRRYAYRHCLLSDVDDAVQESLLIVTRKLAALQILGAFSGWLFRVVQRECRRLERRIFGLDPFDETRAERWLAAHTDSSLRLDLARALESLPEHYRAIVLLRDFEERTIAEIATTIDLSAAATKSRLRRARVLMREYLSA